MALRVNRFRELMSSSAYGFLEACYTINRSAKETYERVALHRRGEDRLQIRVLYGERQEKFESREVHVTLTIPQRRLKKNTASRTSAYAIHGMATKTREVIWWEACHDL